MRERNQPLFRHIWEELAKAQPDEAIINRSIEEANDNKRAYQKDVTAAIGAFLATLSPEQRAEFIEAAKRHQAAHFPRLVKP
jgi:uncharacterized membrane protein